jgi:hypothetical protein
MKTVLLIITCLLCLNSFCQTTEPVIEEKASSWIMVTADPVAVSKPATVKKRTTVVKAKSSKPKSATPKQEATDEFEKTNSQVNRFKKQQKG